MIKSTRQQFADTKLALGQLDKNIVVLVGDIGHGMFKPYAEVCSDRYYNIGILEPTMITIGAGLAASGLCPVMHTIAPFMIERGFEQLKLDFCYHQLPGNIVTVGSAFDYSNLGCTHHCYGDFALLKTLPGTEICFPSSAVEFDQLFRQSYKNKKLTVYRIAGSSHGHEFNTNDIKFGKGICVRDGEDVTFIATGPQLQTALEASDKISNNGISAEVIYIHTIRPLDLEVIRTSIEKTKKVIVIEEHMRSGGLGDDVLRDVYDIPGLKFHSISIPDQFVTGYGTYKQLLSSCGITSESIVEICEAWF
jgi:transketolase